MSLLLDFRAELEQEAGVTRRYLSAVPFDRKGYRPHEKSEELVRLAVHVSEIIGWWTSTIKSNKLDFLGFEPKDITSVEDLLSYFDGLVRDAMTSLQDADESSLQESWSMTYGDDVLFTLPKKEVLRKFCMNHLVHHRAQLGVYLRLLGVDVPAAYGPSADDDHVTLINPFHQDREVL